MATFKIKLREINQGCLDSKENVVITAKNTDTLEEYHIKNYVNPDYIAKIQSWIEKNKYTCEETSPLSLHLSIDQLFDFNLDKT